MTDRRGSSLYPLRKPRPSNFPGFRESSVKSGEIGDMFETYLRVVTCLRPEDRQAHRQRG